MTEDIVSSDDRPRPLRRSRGSGRGDEDKSGAGFLDRDAAFKRYRGLGQDPHDILLPVTIRVNTLKIGSQAILDRLTSIGVEAKKIPFLDHGYEVNKSRFSVGASVEYLMGYFYTQEAASQLAVQVLDPRPGELIADICAAPGGKTTHIAQLMENKGIIVALDKGERVYSIKNNLERCGVSNVICFKKDSRFVTDFGVKFDKILIDAPCSGNFAGDRGWFGKRSHDGIHNRSVLQKELLKAAFHSLKVGGTIVYSTCSLEPEEDEMAIDFAIRKLKGLRVETIDIIGDPGLVNPFGKKLDPSIQNCRRLWPWKTGTQGFFVAKLTKIAEIRPSANERLEGGHVL